MKPFMPRLILLLAAILSGAEYAGAQTVADAVTRAEPAAVSPSLPLEPIAGDPAEKPRKSAAGKRPAASVAPSLDEAASAAFPPNVPGIERVQFARRPIKAVVEAGRERTIHLPFEAVILADEQSPTNPLSIELIGQTMYVNAMAPMPRARVIAQSVEGLGEIPIDIVVHAHAPTVPDEMEIFLPKKADKDGGDKASADSGDELPKPAPDMVQLSRYCAQMLYAPQRLIKPLPGVRQVDVRLAPLANLYRGGSVITTPVAGWRAGALHVTAVRFTNRTGTPVELDMDQLRGRWLAATPQHWRLLPHGSEADTTAVCLISDQAFDVARP